MATSVVNLLMYEVGSGQVLNLGSRDAFIVAGCFFFIVFVSFYRVIFSYVTKTKKPARSEQ